MSLDYPYYEELCRRRHRAALWWIVGDRLYYLGLLPALVALPGVGIAVVAGLLDYGWLPLWLSLATFGIAAVVYFVGACVKQHAYTLGERDGISEIEVFERKEPRTQ